MSEQTPESPEVPDADATQEPAPAEQPDVDPSEPESESTPDSAPVDQTVGTDVLAPGDSEPASDPTSESAGTPASPDLDDTSSPAPSDGEPQPTNADGSLIPTPETPAYGYESGDEADDESEAGDPEPEFEVVEEIVVIEENPDDPGKLREAMRGVPHDDLNPAFAPEPSPELQDSEDEESVDQE